MPQDWRQNENEGFAFRKITMKMAYLPWFMGVYHDLWFIYYDLCQTMIGGFQHMDQCKSLSAGCCNVAAMGFMVVSLYFSRKTTGWRTREGWSFDPFLRANHEAQHRCRSVPVISREYYSVSWARKGGWYHLAKLKPWYWSVGAHIFLTTSQLLPLPCTHHLLLLAADSYCIVLEIWTT